VLKFYELLFNVIKLADEFAVADDELLVVDDDDVATVAAADDALAPIDVTDDALVPIDVADDALVPIDVANDGLVPIDVANDGLVPVGVTDDALAPVDVADDTLVSITVVIAIELISDVWHTTGRIVFMSTTNINDEASKGKFLFIICILLLFLITKSKYNLRIQVSCIYITSYALYSMLLIQVTLEVIFRRPFVNKLRTLLTCIK
jgi:hypothetical protein